MKKLKTCVFSAIVLLVISFRDEAESKPVEFPQEREISLKKEMEIVRRLKRYMEKNDDFIEKSHSGKSSKRSNAGPPSAKEAKESKNHRNVYKEDPHPPISKRKTPGHGHDHGHGHEHGHTDSSDTDSMTSITSLDTDSMDTDSLDSDSLDEHDPHPPASKKKKNNKGHADKGHGNGDGMERTSTRKQPKKTKSAPLVRKQAESKNNDLIENRRNVAIWRRNRGLEHLSIKRKHLRMKRYRGPILTERTS